MRASADGRSSKHAALHRIAVSGAALACGVALLNLANGSLVVHIGPLRISSNGLFRPLAAAALLAAAASWLAGAARVTSRAATASRTRVAAIACAAVTLIVGLSFSTGVAGGSDSYGYVSE